MHRDKHGLMRRHIMTLILSLNVLLPTAFAGGFSGAGGGTIYECRDGDNQITEMNLIELSRETNRLDLQKLLSHREILQQVLSELRSLNASFAADIENQLQQITSRMTFLPYMVVRPFDVDPQFYNDIFGIFSVPLLYPCKEEERISLLVAAIQDFEVDRVLIDSSIWNHATFTEYHKAALIFHEAVYRYLYLNHLLRESETDRSQPYYHRLTPVHRLVAMFFTKEQFDSRTYRLTTIRKILNGEKVFDPIAQ